MSLTDRKILIFDITRLIRSQKSASNGLSHPSGPVITALRCLHHLSFNFRTVTAAQTGRWQRTACLLACPDSGQELQAATTFAGRINAPVTLVINEPAVSTGAIAPDLLRSTLRNARPETVEFACMGSPLTNMTTLGLDAQLVEINHVTSAISEAVGERPRLFVYPKGAYDAATVSCLRSAGFTAAISMREGLNSGGSDESFHLKKITLSGSHLSDIIRIGRFAMAGPAVQQVAGLASGTSHEPA